MRGEDGSEWTAVRNEKRTLERAEKNARKKEKAEREEAAKDERNQRRHDVRAYGEPFARWLAARRAITAMPEEEAWRSCDWAEEEAEARATLSPTAARASRAWIAAESGDDRRHRCGWPRRPGSGTLHRVSARVSVFTPLESEDVCTATHRHT